MIYHVQFPGLGLECTVNRVAFTLFGMPIYWYGILIAAGMMLALLFVFMTLFASTLVDILTAALDPRVKLNG